MISGNPCFPQSSKFHENQQQILPGFCLYISLSEKKKKKELKIGRKIYSLTQLVCKIFVFPLTPTTKAKMHRAINFLAIDMNCQGMELKCVPPFLMWQIVILDGKL